MILAIVNRSSFRVSEYRWYWAGNVLVHITFLLQAVALGWHMLDLTGSALQVGLVAFCYGMPLLVLAPFSGLVADRVKRQWLVQASLCAATATSACLALLASAGGATELPILLTSFALGTCFAFYAPARMALLPKLVPEDMVFNATTLSYSGTRLMGFFGPVLGGLLLDIADFAVTLSVQTALFAIGAGIYFKATWSLPAPKRHKRAGGWLLSGYGEVLAYLRGQRALFALTLLALVFVPLGMPYQKLMPIFVDEVLREGPALLGLLVGSASLGSALSGFAVALVGDVYPKGLAVLVFSSLFGIGLMIFSLMTDSLIAWLLIFVIGVFSGIFLTLINALLLILLPDELRGRMMSLWGMVWGLIPLTTLLAGAVAEQHGISLVLAAAGFCVTAACLVMLATRSPLLEL